MSDRTKQSRISPIVRADAVVPNITDWGSITWHDNAALTGNQVLTVGVVVIKAGLANPAHQHPNCDEALYLLSGRLRHTLGDAEYVLEPGDLIHIPRGVMHRAYSIGDEDAKMIVAYDSGRREVKGE
jgi:quercetin dioxygenase-like cupin family protein